MKVVAIILIVLTTLLIVDRLGLMSAQPKFLPLPPRPKPEWYTVPGKPIRAGVYGDPSKDVININWPRTIRVLLPLPPMPPPVPNPAASFPRSLAWFAGISYCLATLVFFFGDRLVSGERWGRQRSQAKRGFEVVMPAIGQPVLLKWVPPVR